MPVSTPEYLSTHPYRWICNVGFLAITTVLGEWLCMQKELQDIPMTSLSTAGARIEQEMVRQVPVVTILS